VFDIQCNKYVIMTYIFLKLVLIYMSVMSLVNVESRLTYESWLKVYNLSSNLNNFKHVDQ